METAHERKLFFRTVTPKPLVLVGAAALVAILTVPRLALSGPVKGKVGGASRLINPVWNEAKEATSNRYTWREPSPTVRAEFRQLFAHPTKEICVAAMAGPAATPTGAVAFKITGGRTSPVTLVVAPGTTIEFQNRDPFPHRPFVVDQGSMTAADMKSGSVRTWKVPGPGKYEIRDELAPSIRSWIVVEPNVHGVGFPLRDGSFTIPNLPPGEYTLKAFFNGTATGKTVAVVVKNDAPLEVKEELVLAEPDKKADGPKEPEKAPAKGGKK